MAQGGFGGGALLERVRCLARRLGGAGPRTLESCAISMVRIALCQSTDDFEISLGVTTMNDSKDSRKVRQKGTSKGSKQTFSRAKLVGKFPHIRHQPAPKAVYKLDEDVRTAMVDRMMLK
jgi:hypothetical protein